MKNCYKCKHYGALVNQGYWWCNLQLDMDADDCPSYDATLQDNAVVTYAATVTTKENPARQTTPPKQYGEYLVQTGKNKKKRTR